MKPLLATLLVSLCLPTAGVHIACADTPSPDDFAHGLRIETDGNHAIYRVELPESVYQGVTRADLADMRVFNADHDPVPHSLHNVADVEHVVATEQPLPIFPLETVERATGAVTALHITTSADGAVVQLDSAPRQDAERYISHYLVDASQWETGINRLNFDWSGDQDNFVTEISIARSTDLTHWTPVQAKTNLLRLNYQGHRLEQTGVDLSVPPKQYLRISWPAGRDGVSLTGVSAHSSSRSSTTSRNWRTHGFRKVGDAPLAYEFNRTELTPVDRINLQLPQSNTLFDARLLSRASTQQPWRLRHQGMFYRLQVGEHELTHNDIGIDTTQDGQWRLEILSAASGLGDIGPALLLGARNQQLHFLARGAPPYTLAFGSATAEPAPSPMDALLTDIQNSSQPVLIGAAYFTHPVDLGGEARKIPPPPPLPWRQWLLWAILILGILGLAFMALRLLRQMRTP